MLRSPTLLLALTALAVIACSPPAVTPDSGHPDVVTHDVSNDIPQDAEPALTHSPFGNCYADGDCPSGWTCTTNLQGEPRGFCSKNCTGDGDCAVDQTAYPGLAGVCGMVNGMPRCERQCLNGIDCGRDGYTCTDLHALSRTDTTDMVGECTASCDDTNCGTGAMCNHWSGLCEAVGSADPPPGVDNGRPCTMSGASSECRSHQCILPVSGTTHLPTGWNNGACVGTCSVPTGYTISDFWMPSLTLPQANCPANSVCVPSSEDAAGDEGNCLGACAGDSDCRVGEGYYCERTFTLGGPGHMRTKTYTNGWCEPVDCLNDTHHPCPGGYMCRTLVRNLGEGQTENIGVCVTASPDAGTDGGGTDAATDAATDAGGSDAGVDVSLPDAAVDATSGDTGLDV